MALITVKQQTIYLTFHDYNKKLYIICESLKDGWNKQSSLLQYNETNKTERYTYVRIRKSKPNKEYNKI